MNYLTAQIRAGEPKAIKRFLKVAHSSKRAPEKWAALGLTQATYYRVRAELLKQGHTLDA